MTGKIMGVYVIKCLPTGVCYVGSSTNIQKRFQEHRNRIAKGTHQNRNLRYASHKYNPKDFAYIVVEPTNNEAELEAREAYYIKLLGAKCGVFNISTNTRHHNEITRHKISQTVTGGGNHNAKKVICLETCEVFDSVEDAARKYHTDSSHIAKCCNKKQHQSAGKTWRYVKEERNVVAENKRYIQTSLF